MNRLVTLLLFPLVLLACTSVSQVDSDGCIEPIATYSYPASQKHDTATLERILPPAPWQAGAALPDPPSGAQAQDWISLARANEVWVKRTLDFGSNGAGNVQTQFLIYRTDTGKWRFLQESNGKGTIRSGNLYLAKDGTVWGELSLSGTSYFTVYNDRDGEFDTLESSGAVPLGLRLFDGAKTFWIIAPNMGIYSFDLANRQLKQHVSMPDLLAESSLYGSMASLAPNRSIYALSMAGDSETKLLKFSPNTDQIVYIPYKNYLGDTAFSLIVDHSGRVWLGDLGWMTSDGAWYKLVRSPLFITNRAENALQYTWVRPSIILEDSNGNLWFHSENGMTSLDPEKEKWCWFTTEQSNIVEDFQHHLWMIADGKLYERPINP